MRRCDACDTAFTGDLTHCPLCGTPLVGDPIACPLPHPERQRKNLVAVGALALVTVGLLIGVLIMGLAWGASPLAVLASCLAVALNYLFVHNILVHRPDFLRGLQRYFLVVAAMGALAWVAIASPVIPTFVLPAIGLIGCLTDFVLLCVFGHRLVGAYAKYLLFTVVLGLGPLLFVVFGLVTWPGLAWASGASAGLLLAALLLFQGRPLLAEIRRLLHAG